MIDLTQLPGPQRSLLRALARRGAHVARIDGTWRLMRQYETDLRPTAVIDERWLETCSTIGAIAETAGGWRLTPAGQASVKRFLSAPGRPLRAMGRPIRHPKRTETEDVLTWLRRHKGRDGRPLIGAEEFDAGQRLRCDYEQALMRPRITSSWSLTAALNRERMATPGGGVEMIERVSSARERLRRALAAVGPQLAEPLLEACCQQIGIGLIERQRGWPQRSGKLMLQGALRTLAIHYGLRPPDDRGWLRHVEVRHWGADDYRPAIE